MMVFYRTASLKHILGATGSDGDQAKTLKKCVGKLVKQ